MQQKKVSTTTDNNILIGLGEFGLTELESNCYLYLVQAGLSSPSQISKGLAVPRTTVYGALERLLKGGFITEVYINQYRRYEAIIEFVIEKKVQEKRNELATFITHSKVLRRELEDLSLVSKRNSIKQYTGLDGLRQVTWNSLKAEECLRIIEIGLLSNIFSHAESEEFRIQFAKKDVQIHQLTNQKSFNNFTNIKKHIEQWKPRYIPKTELDINIEVQIYNDTVCLYDYTESEIFITEIVNRKLSSMYKQIFDNLWKNATKMKKLNMYGKTKLLL